MDEPSTKSQLLERLRVARDELDRLVAGLSDARLIRPGVSGTWSVKDLLVHIMDWEQYLVRRLQAAKRGLREPLRILETDADLDRLNEQVIRANRAIPPDQARSDSKRSFELVLESLEPLSNEDLFDLARAETLIGDARRPVWKYIAVETYEHYQEHTEAIRAWLGRYSIPEA